MSRTDAPTPDAPAAPAAPARPLPNPTPGTARMARPRQVLARPRAELPLVFARSGVETGPIGITEVLHDRPAPRARAVRRRRRRAIGLLAPMTWTLAMGACAAGALVVRDSMFPHLGATTRVETVWQATTVPKAPAKRSTTSDEGPVASAAPADPVVRGDQFADPAITPDPGNTDSTAAADSSRPGPGGGVTKPSVLDSHTGPNPSGGSPASTGPRPAGATVPAVSSATSAPASATTSPARTTSPTATSPRTTTATSPTTPKPPTTPATSAATVTTAATSPTTTADTGPTTSSGSGKGGGGGGGGGGHD